MRCVILASKLVFILEIQVPNISELSTKSEKVKASCISFLLYQYTCKLLVCYSNVNKTSGVSANAADIWS